LETYSHAWERGRELSNSPTENLIIVNSYVFVFIGDKEARANLEREGSTLEWPPAGRPGRTEAAGAVNLARALFNRISDGFLGGD
jgi:hypothetical protein